MIRTEQRPVPPGRGAPASGAYTGTLNISVGGGTGEFAGLVGSGSGRPRLLRSRGAGARPPENRKWNNATQTRLP